MELNFVKFGVSCCLLDSSLTLCGWNASFLQFSAHFGTLQCEVLQAELAFNCYISSKRPYSFIITDNGSGDAKADSGGEAGMRF